MKLEAGQFVRTKDGYIDKILLVEYAEEKRKEYPNHPSKSHWRDKILLLKAGYWRTTQNIIKASYNIIDLISRFDFVNGHLVICKMYEDEKDIPTIIKCVGDYYFKEEDIKSIVTKQQFSQISYNLSKDK